MLSDYYNSLKDVERTFEEIVQDDMSKTTGYWFSKGMNKLLELRLQLEQDMMSALGITKVENDD